MFREFFFFSMCYYKTWFYKYAPLCAQSPDTVFVSGGREGVDPRHVVRNFFVLRLVTLVVCTAVVLTLGMHLVLRFLYYIHIAYSQVQFLRS
jgi:hypothetical protein